MKIHNKKKVIIELFIIGAVCAIISIGALIGFNVFLITQDNTTEFCAIVSNSWIFSSSQELIVVIETECFEQQLHFSQRRNAQLNYVLRLSAGDKIRFRVRNRYAYRLKDGGHSVDLVTFMVWGLLESQSDEDGGVYFDNEIWGYRVALDIDGFNQEWILPSIIIPSVFGGAAIIFFVLAIVFLINHLVKKGEKL
ncbi:MAG: hypothetical protein FWE03_04665 [Firmicutes bacterium]|nr:hypothetical protein [Bacillota bacterium]